VVPVAAWTVGLALSGFQPVPEDAADRLSAMWGGASLPAESRMEVEASTERALEVLRRTWVGSEIVWSWAALVAAWWFLGRLGQRGQRGGVGPMARFDLPDAWIAVFVAGLVLVLLGTGESGRAAGTAGWNLLCGTGLLFTVRGVAVQVFWMDRAGWTRAVRALVLSAGLLLAAPVFLVVGAGLGLFDAGFDFRRMRAGEGSS
jgi:hypothetical protein